METRRLFTPIQEWLLGQGRCSGCGRMLSEGYGEWVDRVLMVLCACQRIFAYDPDRNVYQRSLE